MKKSPNYFSLSIDLFLLCFLTTILVIFCGCRQIKPVSPTSYDAVTSQLDPLGSFYMYADTRQLMAKLASQKKKTSLMVKSIFKDKQTRELAGQVTDLAMNTLINSGITQLDGIGASSIKFNKELYRCKFIAQRKSEIQPDTLVWKVFGKNPHELKSLEMLPANTAFASFFDFDSIMAGKFISRELKASNIEKLLTNKNMAIRAFVKATGMSPRALCETLGEHFGIFFTLNKAQTFLLPINGKFEKFPEITFNIVISVKDSTLFNLILKKLPKQLNPQEKNENDIRMVVMNQIPLMLRLQPAIGQKNGLLIISSQPETIREFFNPDTKTKLIATAKFKKLSENIPTAGNGYKYVSPEICNMMFKMQKFFIAVRKMKQPNDIPAPSPEYNAQLAKFYKDLKNFSVYQCLPNSIVAVANSNINLPGVITLNAILAPFIYSAILMEPAIQKTAERRNEIQCVNNLKQIGTALMLHVNDFNDKFPKPGIAGLNKIYKLYIPDPKIFICPATNDISAKKAHPLFPKNVSYIYLGVSTPVTKIKYPMNTPIAFDKPGNHKNAVNVLFADGHVERIQGNFKTCSDIAWALSRNLPEDVRIHLMKTAAKLDKKN